MNEPSSTQQAPTIDDMRADRREFLKTTGATAAALGVLFAAGSAALAADARTGYTPPRDADNFYKSERVTVQKVSFKNQYQMNVAGNLFVPRSLDRSKKTPAIVVGHPMGAVKEQSANLYATKMAELGFVTLSLDLPFWGGSDGQPRNAVAPDLYAETFSAAVDFLGTQAFVDKQQIGAIGICGSGGFVVSAAKVDPRLKAVATVSMYDMGGVSRRGLRRSQTLEQRKTAIAEAVRHRGAEFAGGKKSYTSGTVHELDDNSSAIEREFYEFYRTPPGARSPRQASRRC